MKLKFCIFIISIFTFQACEKKADERFVKTWYDTEYIIRGRTILPINSDFTFKYNARGCEWHTILKGKWSFIGDTTELNSTRIDTSYNMFPFAEYIKFGEYNNKKIPTTIPNCTAESGTDYTLFNKEKFYLKNDSLVYKRKANSNCSDSLRIVFAKMEKRRKNGY
jgi:hypothetical protein